MGNQEAIDDDEIIYRRVPLVWFDEDNDEIKPDVFRPRKDDTTGISVTRARSDKHPNFPRAEDVARFGNPSKGFFVAELKVADLRQEDIEVVARPLPENAGHAEISSLTYANSKDKSSRTLIVLLAHKLVRNVEGPFFRDSD